MRGEARWANPMAWPASKTRYDMDAGYFRYNGKRLALTCTVTGGIDSSASIDEHTIPSEAYQRR